MGAAHTYRIESLLFHSLVFQEGPAGLGERMSPVHSRGEPHDRISRLRTQWVPGALNQVNPELVDAVASLLGRVGQDLDVKDLMDDITYPA